EPPEDLPRRLLFAARQANLVKPFRLALKEPAVASRLILVDVVSPVDSLRKHESSCGRAAELSVYAMESNGPLEQLSNEIADCDLHARSPVMQRRNPRRLSRLGRPLAYCARRTTSWPASVPERLREFFARASASTSSRSSMRPHSEPEFSRRVWANECAGLTTAAAAAVTPALPRIAWGASAEVRTCSDRRPPVCRRYRDRGGAGPKCENSPRDKRPKDRG